MTAAATLALLLLFSCTKSEVQGAVESEDGRQYPVQVSSYLERARTSIPRTKNPGDTLVNPLGEGGCFNMRSYYNIDATHQQPFFSCALFTYDNKKYFVSSPTYYWPVSGTLDFYAASPTTFAPDSVMTVNIRDGKTDFVASMSLGNSRCNAVSMTFGHKLTKLSFAAKGTDTSLSYEITSIKVVADSSAKYRFGSQSDLSAQSWVEVGTSHDTLAYEYFDRDTTQTIAAGESGPQALAGLLMLLPLQDSVSLKVAYKAKYNGTLVADATKTVSLKNTLSKWGINKHVLYSLSLTPDAAPITFSATQSDWTDAGEQNVPESQ